MRTEMSDNDLDRPTGTVVRHYSNSNREPVVNFLYKDHDLECHIRSIATRRHQAFSKCPIGHYIKRGVSHLHVQQLEKW